MDWGELVVQWFHILAGTFWFGGVLYANFVVVPVVMQLPAAAQATTVRMIGAQSKRVMPIAALITILLGFVRGTIFGDVKSVADLTTAYGMFWLIGLVAAAATFAWGEWVLSPAAERMTDAGSGGTATLARVRMYAQIELLGFLVIFTTMILMHFAGEA